MAGPLPRPPARFKEIRTNGLAHYRIAGYTQATNKRQGCSRMKLVEILAKAWIEWPAGCRYAVCDTDGEVRAIGTGTRSDFYPSIPVDKEGRVGSFALLGDDAKRVIRADWEAERANIIAASVITGKPAKKADKHGWIRHRGGKCPVEAGVLVDVRHRDGDIFLGERALDGSAESWGHTGSIADIMAYRLHKPAEQLAPVSERKTSAGGKTYLAPETLDKAARNGDRRLADGIAATAPVDTMIAIRDRIRELDTQRAEVESTYQCQISEITQERESLVQKLADEGLLMAPVD